MGRLPTGNAFDAPRLDDLMNRSVSGREMTTLTSAQLAEMPTLSAVLSVEQMADYYGIPRSTFWAMLQRDETLARVYQRGRASAFRDVGNSVLTKARAGDMVAAVFFLKTQARWRETDPPAGLPPKEGNFDLADYTVPELQALLAGVETQLSVAAKTVSTQDDAQPVPSSSDFPSIINVLDD